MSAIAFAVRAGANLPARMPSAEALLALCALGVVKHRRGVLALLLHPDRRSGRGTRVGHHVVMPAVAVVLGIAVLSEPFNAGTALGLALILGATALATVYDRARGSERRRRVVADARSP